MRLMTPWAISANPYRRMGRAPNLGLNPSTSNRSLKPSSTCTATPLPQWLTLVHFSAQRKRFLWNRGCN